MSFSRKAQWKLALILAAGIAAGRSARADEIHNPTAVFAGLDKITGRIITFDVAIDETVQFGTLQITPRVCITRPQTEAPLTEGFVQVDDVESAKDARRIFSGWMFAASPGLHGVEHPVYDVWLKDCKGGKTVVASPSPGVPRVNAPPPANAQPAPASGAAAPAPGLKPRTIKPQEPEEPKVDAPPPSPDAEPAPADAAPAAPPAEAASPPAEAVKPPSAAPAPLPPPIEVGAPPGSGAAASPPPPAAASPSPEPQRRKHKPPRRKPPADVERLPLEPGRTVEPSPGPF
jgi:hypothetical protein